MNKNYDCYKLDDVFMRTFMTPAVEMKPMVTHKAPNTISNTNNQFASPNQGFLVGNMQMNTYIPYKNINYIKPVINNDRQAMLYKVQEMSFAAHDINLYLDTHPNDSNAIKTYNEYNKRAEMFNNQYESKYGPIDLSDEENLSITPWSWIKEPWPWNE